MKIYIVRHGQTDKNKDKLLQGRSNSPLNRAGKEQCIKLRKYFSDRETVFDRIYSSPLIRAVQTAEIARGENRPEIITCDSLLEMDYGPYEGISLENMPRELKTFFSDFVHNPAPDGMESLSDVTRRLGRFLESIKDCRAENVMISTHAIAMKGALEYLTPQSHGSYWSKFIGNCRVYVCEYSDGGFTVPEELRLT